MRWFMWTLLPVTLALVIAGCGSSDDRQWLKVDQKYTTDEFRRDHAACMRNGKLDDACMRSRGWVAVNPGKSSEPKVDPNASPLGATPRRGSY
jgi:hypothetical protein